MTASVAAATDPLVEPAATRRAAALARQEADAEALEARQLSERFAPLSASAEPPDGPVPGYPSNAPHDDEGTSAFAPRPGASGDLPEETHQVGEDDRSGVEGYQSDASEAADSEPSDQAAEAADVGDLEQEMARLLDQISTSRRE